MAYRIIVQLALTYGVATGRAVYRAWKASAASSAANSASSGPAHAVTGLTSKEARDILNVTEMMTEDEITGKYKHIYEANAADRGNSFYLQSKAYRAHETLVAHRAEPEVDPDADEELRPPVAEEDSKVKSKQ